MGKHYHRNFKSTRSKEIKNNKEKETPINNKRVVGEIWPSKDKIYGSISQLVKPYDYTKLAPFQLIDNNNKEYLKNAIDKFSKYEVNDNVWGKESAYSLIHVFPHKKK
jgi:hypothetical protein